MTKFSIIVKEEISKLIEDPMHAHLIISFFWREMKTPKDWDNIKTRVMIYAINRKLVERKIKARNSSING